MIHICVTLYKARFIITCGIYRNSLSLARRYWCWSLWNESLDQRKELDLPVYFSPKLSSAFPLYLCMLSFFSLPCISTVRISSNVIFLTSFSLFLSLFFLFLFLSTTQMTAEHCEIKLNVGGRFAGESFLLSPSKIYVVEVRVPLDRDY